MAPQVPFPPAPPCKRKSCCLVILLPLHPASLMHKNPQRHKINHGMRPVGKDQSIDLNMCICRNIRPIQVISVAVIHWQLSNNAYLF